MVVKFLPVPSDSPPLCVCGEPLEMEHERDACECVDCTAKRSGIHPFFAQLIVPFTPSTFRSVRHA